ncbi:MAG: XRE family transcriptional regulator [Oscillospiraceae bacterium]|nr:XRE family transcriptional regulator [Oscillospiraceae bacterium]
MGEFNIGKRLKTVRQNRNLTLDELAEVTGVSKPMLGQIERGQSSPTVTTLWKIATGMKIPFSTFLQEQETEYTVVDLQEQDVLLEESGAMKVYTLFAFDPIRSCEAFYIEFEAGCEHDSDKHNDGVEEYIFVTHGKLDMVLNGTKVTLREKQAIRFEANIPHSYVNAYKDTCNIYNFIFYKE